jgi:hypothetical protein
MGLNYIEAITASNKGVNFSPGFLFPDATSLCPHESHISLVSYHLIGIVVFGI